VVNLKPEELQAEMELVQHQLELAKAVQAGNPLPQFADVELPAGPLDTVTWALSTARVEALERLNPTQLQNEIELLS